MKAVMATVAALAAAGQARAEDIVLKPLAELRTRYEHVTQDDIARDADAVTVRVRAGVQAELDGVTASVEAQGTLAPVDHYYDGLRGTATRAIVSDPQNVALYLAQLRYARPGIAVTAGRQRIVLDDERFVGNAAFRANSQTFDAVRIEWSPAERLKADVSYAWSVRTIWGIDGRNARQQAVSGSNVFANLAYRTSLGTLTGFAYLIDQDEAAVQNFRLSSQTYGARFAGSHAFSKQAKLSYQTSYARQSDYHRNPNRYAANYYLVDLALDLRQFRIGGGYEVLGADRGVTLAAFETPLSSVFKFQGWADKFLTTPPDGVRDLYGSAGYTLETGTRLGAIAFQATYHRFDSDRLVRLYGDEIDAIASMKIKRTAISLRYADYRARGFATDTHKVWVQADWTL